MFSRICDSLEYKLKRKTMVLGSSSYVRSFSTHNKSFVHHSPPNSFYSWRRYCNKHQIRLGGYIMNLDRGDTPDMDEDQEIDEEEPIMNSLGPMAPIIPPQIDPNLPRNRSPTPPRALFRSTTGKGVAFTNQDITFLVRFMDYRKYVVFLANLVYGMCNWLGPAFQVARPAWYGYVLEGGCCQSKEMIIIENHFIKYVLCRPRIILGLHGWSTGGGTNTSSPERRMTTLCLSLQKRRCGIAKKTISSLPNTSLINRKAR